MSENTLTQEQQRVLMRAYQQYEDSRRDQSRRIRDRVGITVTEPQSADWSVEEELFQLGLLARVRGGRSMDDPVQGYALTALGEKTVLDSMLPLPTAG